MSSAAISSKTSVPNRQQRLALAGLELLLELVDAGIECLRRVVVEHVGLAQGVENLGVAAEVVEQLALEAQDVFHRNLVELAVGAGPDRDDLVLDRVRRVLRLPEQLGQARAAGELAAARGIQVGREHRERLERAVLGELELERSGDLLDRLDLGVTTDSGDRDADVDRGALVGVEQVGLQEDLAVGDRDDVGRDVGRDVVGLGLDDRQAGHRAGAQLVGELGATLEQTGVQVEHVAGVGLAARRATQQQRHRAVGLGLLGQVVEDDQDVLARVHPVLADGRAGVGGEVLEAGGSEAGPRRSSCTPARRPPRGAPFTAAMVEPFWPMAT